MGIGLYHTTFRAYDNHKITYTNPKIDNPINHDVVNITTILIIIIS